MVGAISRHRNLEGKMTLKIEIELDNAAFEAATEVQRILNVVGNRHRNGDLKSGYEEKLRDYNGNTVGTAKVMK